MAVIVTVSDSVLDVGNDGVGVGLYAALNNRALKEGRRRGRGCSNLQTMITMATMMKTQCS